MPCRRRRALPMPLLAAGVTLAAPPALRPFLERGGKGHAGAGHARPGPAAAAALAPDLVTGRSRRAAAALGGALAALALLLPPGAAAVAQPNPPAAQPQRVVPPSVLPGLGLRDPRSAVDGAAHPWGSLGRVQIETGGRCTGALIGRRTVLTAAHCLVARRAGTLVQPGSVHFLLGYNLGHWAAHARVTSFVVGPGYEPSGRGPASADWAILTLDLPQAVGSDRILPLLREPLPRHAPLMLGGYQQDRPEVIQADSACRALGYARDGAGRPMLVHDCAGTRGASGGPLLARGPEGRWAVAGIASTAALEAAMGLAVPAALVAGRIE